MVYVSISYLTKSFQMTLMFIRPATISRQPGEDSNQWEHIWNVPSFLLFCLIPQVIGEF